MGVLWGQLMPPNAPMMGGIMGASDASHDAPMLFFDNLVKSFHQIVKK